MGTVPRSRFGLAWEPAFIQAPSALSRPTCLVVPAKSPDLLNAVAQCFLPGPGVHLLPISCRNPCRPNSHEQVVGHCHAFRG